MASAAHREGARLSSATPAAPEPRPVAHPCAFSHRRSRRKVLIRERRRSRLKPSRRRPRRRLSRRREAVRRRDQTRPPPRRPFCRAWRPGRGACGRTAGAAVAGIELPEVLRAHIARDPLHPFGAYHTTGAPERMKFRGQRRDNQGGRRRPPARSFQRLSYRLLSCYRMQHTMFPRAPGREASRRSGTRCADYRAARERYWTFLPGFGRILW